MLTLRQAQGERMGLTNRQFTVESGESEESFVILTYPPLSVDS